MRKMSINFGVKKRNVNTTGSRGGKTRVWHLEKGESAPLKNVWLLIYNLGCCCCHFVFFERGDLKKDMSIHVVWYMLSERWTQNMIPPPPRAYPIFWRKRGAHFACTIHKTSEWPYIYGIIPPHYPCGDGLGLYRPWSVHIDPRRVASNRVLIFVGWYHVASWSLWQGPVRPWGGFSRRLSRRWSKACFLLNARWWW